MWVLLLLIAIVLVYWGIEAVRLHRALRAIPIRIHVNGSRGKSSVTRLLAAALRESGMRTAAKTTGSRARYILPDGSEEPLIRLGSPNICEQVGVLDRARREKAEAIVIECMAVRPDIQVIAEDGIVRSTIGVITNVRADHLDVMGPTVADVAYALSATLPRKGFAVVPPTHHVDVLQEQADARGTHLEIADPRSLPEGAMSGFAYLEHEENVATCLAVTRKLGIPDEAALRGMYRVIPDPGACTSWTIEHAGRTIEFHNIFAANDLESTASVWKRLGLDRSGDGPTVALLNLRADRVDRSVQFAEAVEQLIRADHYAIVGDTSDRVLRRYARRVPAERLHALGKMSPGEVFDRLAAIGEGTLRVGAIGNIGGIGHEILQYVYQRRREAC
ncbi:MAG: poly-gamma-glutamate synthase PgsB [Candidatus Eisenbacteria bacterium]|nr:poly-gamma-glutamate synthase PgsB [Candidatus Eisenbacteria bacterium]